jgi:polyisoprenoid-binding protein YceI
MDPEEKEGRGSSSELHLLIGHGLWQNRLNYSGSSALVSAIQATLTQRTSNGTTHWSVGSPSDSTTVTQDRGRFTSHEGEFTITPQLINFKFTEILNIITVYFKLK